MRTAATLAAAAVVALCSLAAAQTPSKAASLPQALSPIQFLLGEWDGGGGGTPGQASGGTRFYADLQDRVVIRTNFAVTAATSTSPASRHDDLMVIYADEKGIVRADYYDNEGHAIRYSVAFPSPGRAVFTSEAGAAPRFRLSYEAAPNGAVKGAFSMTSAAAPDAFTPYLAWEMRRVRR